MTLMLTIPVNKGNKGLTKKNNSHKQNNMTQKIYYNIYVITANYIAMEKEK